MTLEMCVILFYPVHVFIGVTTGGILLSVHEFFIGGSKTQGFRTDFPSQSASGSC